MVTFKELKIGISFSSSYAKYINDKLKDYEVTSKYVCAKGNTHHRQIQIFLHGYPLGVNFNGQSLLLAL